MYIHHRPPAGSFPRARGLGCFGWEYQSPMQSILKGGGGPILLDSNAQNPKAWVSYLSCWHLIALLIRFRVARNGFYSTRGVENLIRGNNSLRGIERYARRIRGLAFATCVLRGWACWSRVAKLDCVVFVGTDGFVAGNYSWLGT